MRMNDDVNTQMEAWEPFPDLCVSSLREGHANLLCIVPISTDVTEVTAHVLAIHNV
jgi:hypothetical protein